MALFTRDEAAAATPAADGNAYRYWAFLSYSHADTKAADRLHRFLEHFRLPDSLVGQAHPLGTVPKRLTPIFRDRSELAASSSLGREIQEALLASRYLIVLCSPAAAKSRWVDQEIRDYKRLHGEDRVLAAIVAGEPFSEGEDECFPPALRHRVGRDGKLTKQKVEPIAADLREDRDGQRIGSLKIAAGMLEVGLDDLVQRDQQRRHKRMTWIVAASIAGMTFTTGLSVVAINARDAARDERREAEGLVGFMLGDLKDELEPIGRLDALDKVGVRALAYYERQDKSDLSDDQLAQRSKALTLLGQIATSRGDTEGALARYREALRSTGELVDRSPEDAQRLFDHAQNVFYVGELAQQRGDLDEAERYFRDYQSLAGRMVAADPVNPKWRLEQVYAAENMGIALLKRRRFTDATRAIETAIAPMKKIIADRPGNDEYVRELSTVLAWVGDARRDEGKLEGAIAAREEQIALLRQQLSSERSNVVFREHLVPAHQALAVLLAAAGRPTAAIDQVRRAIAEANGLFAIEPDNTTWQGYAAKSYLELASTLLQLRRNAEASSAIQTGCRMIVALRTRDSSVVAWHSDATRCLLLRAKLALVTGSSVEARALARNALSSAQSERSEDRIKDRYSVAAAYRQLAEVELRLRNAQGARAALNNGLKQLPIGIAERPREMAIRADLLRQLGKLDEARAVENRLRSMGFQING